MKTDRELLLDANTIIRSFRSIIDRQGKTTNWEGLAIQTSRILKEQHDVLFPTDGFITTDKADRINQNIEKLPSVVINEITYWFDMDFEWVENNWYYKTYAVIYFEKINKGNLIVFDYKDPFALFKYHHHSLHGSHAACMGKPYLVIAQSKPFLENIPVFNPHKLS